MKNSVLILGVALLSLSGVCNAKNIVSLPASFQNSSFSEGNREKKSNEKAKFEKPSLAEDVEEFNPETIIAYQPKTEEEIISEGDKIVENLDADVVKFAVDEKSIKEKIAQLDLIIENKISNQIHPLYIERTAEDEIAELELIIESTETNVVSPLDFEIINRDFKINNSLKTKNFLGMN